MSGFSISFTGELTRDDPPEAVGAIHLGDDRDVFSSALGFWSRADYEASWSAALERVIEGYATSCLLTSVTDPASANFLVGWPLYRSGQDVYVQNCLILMDELENEFDLSAPWESVLSREDDEEVSEWYVPLADIVAFISEGSRSDGG